MPTLLRVGAAEAFAYRVEFVVWMFTNTMPLIMLALWTAVAREAPFAGFSSRDFVAYYLIAMIVRTVTGSWVVWQLNEEVRTGTLSMRLLRPVHPFVTFAGTHLSAIPLRGVVALPMAAILLATSARGALTGDPIAIAVFAGSLVGAWSLMYFWMLIVGTLSFWIEKSTAVFDLYLGVVAVLSGYLIPLELLPSWLRSIAGVLPFQYMLGFPADVLMGRYGRAAALAQLGAQWAYVAATVAVAVALWRAGVRRFEAYGA